MAEPLRVVLMVAHLAVAAIWLGSMAYSLTVLQPKVARFFPDVEDREQFLLLLAHGNRWKVVGLLATLMISGLGATVGSDGLVAIGYPVSLLLYAAAGAIFWYVSWRHWPARVFAVVEELPAFQHRLRVLAGIMLLLVGMAFVVALSVSVAPR